MPRKTKIIVTLGPATEGPRALAAIKARGVDFVRTNMSHSSLEYLGRSLAAAAEVGLPFVIDTEGSQVRTGELNEPVIRVEENAEIRLWNTPVTGNQRELCLRPPSVLAQLQEGDLLHIDFDTLVLRVTDVSTAQRGYVAARAVTGGFVGRNKAVVVDPVVPRRIELPALSAKDLESIQLGLAAGAGHIAVSFVRSGAAVDEVRSVTNGRMSIISKIECVEALERLDEIIERSDWLLLDRGDLSKEIPLERIPFVQKIVIHKARARGKGVFVATNLLETMIERRQPTRAEIQDITNTILDGAAGLTMAAETAVGKHPIECINMLNRLIEHAEAAMGCEAPTAPPLVAALADGGYLIETGGWPSLPRPHGGRLVRRVIAPSDGGGPAIALDRRQQMDLELIAHGALSPLEGFMGPADLESVLARMQLADGTPWPMPVLLDVTEAQAAGLAAGQRVTLTDEAGRPIGLLDLTEVFAIDRRDLARRLDDPDGQADTGPIGLAGSVQQFARRDSGTNAYELTPRQTRRLFLERGWQHVLGDARGDLDERLVRRQRRMLDESSCDGLFIQVPLGDAGQTGLRPADRVRDCERAVERLHGRDTVLVAGLASDPRHASVREVLRSALILMNYGCSHFLLHPEHVASSPGLAEALDLAGDLGISFVEARQDTEADAAAARRVMSA